MFEALFIAAVFASQMETWRCFVEARDPLSDAYETTFVVTGDQIVETNILPQRYRILHNDDKSIVFASFNFGVDDFAGNRIDQMATVIAIDRKTETMRRVFIQDDGTRLEHVDGKCAKILV
jgi:hypothetical protein